MEVWKKIEGYDNYEVSNTGKVRTHNWMNQGITKEMSPSKCRGYLQVNLFRNNRQKCFRIHRLVAKAFIPNPNNLREVNRIDGNKENNSVENLEWCTREENLKHEHRTGLGNKAREGLIRSFEARRKAIIATPKNGGEKMEFISIQEAGRQLNINATKICACLKGRAKSTSGYVFEYKEEE